MSATAAARPAPMFSLRFTRAYIVTMRPYLLFVSGITGIAGVALGEGVPTLLALAVAAASFLAYGFGQALTDCTQTDTDALSAPYRPLVRGEVLPRDVAAVSLAGLAAVGAVFAAIQPFTLVLAAAGTAGLATYTRFKRIWWSGPFYNAWIVAVLCAMGRLSASAAATVPPVLSAATIGTFGAAFFGYANFVLSGYFKDVSADRATGYHTLPVTAGFRVSAVASDVFAVAALACAIAAAAASAGAWERLPLPATGFLAAAAVLTLIAQVRLHRTRDERDAHRAIAPVVHAYILLLSGLAVARQPDWAPALAAYFLAYLAVLHRRPMRTQI